MKNKLKICGTHEQIKCFNLMICDDTITSFHDLLLHVINKKMEIESTHTMFGNFTIRASNDKWALKAKFLQTLNILEIENMIWLKDAVGYDSDIRL